MPSFFEIFWRPWKVVATILTYGLAGRTSSPSGAGGSSSICVMRDLGSPGAPQMQAICNLWGYDAPAFVFYASLGIFALFAGATLMLLLQSHRLARGLAALASAVENTPRPRVGEPLRAQDLDPIKDAFSNDLHLAERWHAFEDALVITPREREVYATDSVDSAFSRAAVIETRLHAATYAMIPGVLTGLGLLMTFVAILDGLSHVSVSASMDVAGIGGLINGLSGKFISSIVALACSITFTFVERFALARPERAYRRLTTALSARFRRRTAEQLLWSIQMQLDQSARTDNTPPIRSA